MADVFLSYERHDQGIARVLVPILDNLGWSVWWDARLQPRADEAFAGIIEREISFAHAVVALWSGTAVSSQWVVKEARAGLEARKLIQATLDGTQPPPDFAPYNYASLVSWDGLATHPGVVAIAEAIDGFAPRDSLSAIEAQVLIETFGSQRRASFGEAVAAARSPFGTLAFRAPAKDGLGAAYCHASGALKGQVYYVRKGIAIMYEQELNGSDSPLGLPVSNEEIVDGAGFPTTFFEAGYIDWSPETWLARAFLYRDDEPELIGQAEV